MRRFRWIGVLCLSVILLTGCTNFIDTVIQNRDSNKKYVVVTTSFLADIVDEITKGRVDVDLIIPAGEDPHMYVAKPRDVTKIKNADLLLYHGLHFEGKMVEVLEKRGFPVTKKFTSMDLGIMEEDGHRIVDPHFWFDIKLYTKAVNEAYEKLIELTPEYKEEYKKNLDEYKNKLKMLDEENRKLLNEIPKESRYLITPHDAFNYFSKMYNIEVVSPQGTSTESEISNKDVEITANFIVNHKVKAIFSESTTNPERMQKLKEVVKSKGYNVNILSGEGKELFSDSLATKGNNGDTYIDMYRHNIRLIYENLK